jgi:hypothetical protein
MARNTIVPRKLNAYDRMRRERRDGFWPDSDAVIYDKTAESGFCTVPRTLALIATLIRQIGEDDASRVYWDLWTRQRDDGYVEIEDASESAAAAGLLGTRALKSWRGKIEELQRLGFIRVRQKGNQPYRYVLLLNPHDVVQRIRQEEPERISDTWWSYFETRIQDIGATLRSMATPEKSQTAE